jgi:hypothetical protein
MEDPIAILTASHVHAYQDPGGISEGPKQFWFALQRAGPRSSSLTILVTDDPRPRQQRCWASRLSILSYCASPLSLFNTTSTLSIVETWRAVPSV